MTGHALPLVVSQHTTEQDGRADVSTPNGHFFHRVISYGAPPGHLLDGRRVRHSNTPPGPSEPRDESLSRAVHPSRMRGRPLPGGPT